MPFCRAVSVMDDDHGIQIMSSMFKHLATVIGGSFLIGAACGQTLENDFANPPVDSRARAFWCWFNGSMTKEQITRDLHEMKDKGMSGAEIWDVSAHRNPDGFVPAGPAFLGEESLDLIAHAIREGTVLRFVCCNHGQQLIVPSPNSGASMIDFIDPAAAEFPAGWGIKDGARQIDRLAPWTDSEEVPVKSFAGTATYTTTIELPEAALSDKTLSIDLGDAKEMAEVFLNGKSLGIVLTPPYRVSLGGAARPGKNELKVQVTKLWANRIIGDITHPEQGTFTRTNMAGAFKAGDTPLPSGLLGPVTILTE
jgi:hypothetical protein